MIGDFHYCQLSFSFPFSSPEMNQLVRLRSSQTAGFLYLGINGGVPRHRFRIIGLSQEVPRGIHDEKAKNPAGGQSRGSEPEGGGSEPGVIGS